MIKQFIQTGP